MSTRKQRHILIASIGSLALTLLLFEALGRVWVAIRWPDAMAYELTHATSTRGRFTTHAGLGYVLTPNFTSELRSHDTFGMRRGTRAETTVARSPGVSRVVVMGASTVYGPNVSDDSTAASLLERRLADSLIPAEVINAGVPGWTSNETLRSWRERVAPLQPDVVIVVDGRNEAFAQLWNGYRDDYSHYRDPSYELQTSNLALKKIFRVSHLAMIFITRGQWFGFDRQAEHPLYGAIDYGARPTPEQAKVAATEEHRSRGFEQNLRQLTRQLRAEGIAPVLATIPFRPDGFGSGVFPEKLPYIDAITKRVRANNEQARALAAREGVPLVDLETLSTEALLVDDCHFNAEGEREAANLMHETIAPLLAGVGS